jgi:putative endonuclease
MCFRTRVRLPPPPFDSPGAPPPANRQVRSWQASQGECPERAPEGRESKGASRRARVEGRESKGASRRARVEGRESKGASRRARVEGHASKGTRRRARVEGRESKGASRRANAASSMTPASQPTTAGVPLEAPLGRWHRRLTVTNVYILRCADGALYIGVTNDLDLRLIRHNDGSASRFTADRRPVVLVYSETHWTRQAALKRERQLKGWTRAKKEALIAGNAGLLRRL